MRQKYLFFLDPYKAHKYTLFGQNVELSNVECFNTKRYGLKGFNSLILVHDMSEGALLDGFTLVDTTTLGLKVFKKRAFPSSSLWPTPSATFLSLNTMKLTN